MFKIRRTRSRYTTIEELTSYLRRNTTFSSYYHSADITAAIDAANIHNNPKHKIPYIHFTWARFPRGAYDYRLESGTYNGTELYFDRGGK